MSVDSVWYPVPAWWVPTFLETQLGAGAVDPLERAALRFLALDTPQAPRTPESMALALRMDPAMVHGAVARLHSRGWVEPVTDGSWRRTAQVEDIEVVRERREAWVPWDPVDGRPLLGVWLGSEPPQWEEGPRPWLEHGASERPQLDGAARPRPKEVAQALRLLTSVDDPLVLEAVGRHAELFQGEILRLYPRLDAPRPGWMAVYVEHRPTGSAVWRPQPAPTQEVETELDPAGWVRFLDRMADRRQRLEEEEDARTVGRDVLARLEVATVAELRAKLRVRLGLELGRRVSAALRDAAVEAAVQQQLAEATDQPWRRALTGWTEVLERWLRDVSEGLALPALQGLEPNEGDWDAFGARARMVRERLGPSWGPLKQLLKKRELHQLRQLMTADRATGGARVLALAAAMAVDDEARAGIVALDDRVAILVGEGLFPALNRLVSERNAITHAHSGADEVGGVGFRDRVLALLRAHAVENREVKS